MRTFLIYSLLLIFGCSSARTNEGLTEVPTTTTAKAFEEITEALTSSYTLNRSWHISGRWIPIDAPAIEYYELTDVEIAVSEQDQEFCVDIYREGTFEQEAIAVLILLDCMNRKGWRLNMTDFLMVLPDPFIR